MQPRGKVEIESAQPTQDEAAGHSLDRPACAIGQRDVDAAQIKWPRQTLGTVALAPTLDPVCKGKTGNDRGVGQGELRNGTGKLAGQHIGLRADDMARPALEALGKRFRRGEERRPITFANCAKPVAEVRVDSRDNDSVRSVGLRKQGRGRGDARQRHAESDGEAARSGQIRSFRITGLDAAAKRIELELI